MNVIIEGGSKVNKLYQFIKRGSIFFVILLISCCFWGCGYKDNLAVIDINVEMAADEPQHKDNEVKTIGVYVDATPSMEGYLGWHRYSLNSDYPASTEQQEKDYKDIVQETIYKLVLNKINNNISGSYNAEVKYYSIDTTLWTTTLNSLLEAQDYKFYRDSEDKNNDISDYKNKYKMVDEYKGKYSSAYEEPSISFAVENAIKEDLAIIITDLYENKKNSNQLINSLKYSAQKKDEDAGVALIGVKSQYAGKVYDIEGGSERDYGVIEKGEEVTAQSVKYRPFYIIVIGNGEKVEAFVEAFKSEMDVENVQMECTLQKDLEVYGLDYDDYEEYKFSRPEHISPTQIEIYHNENFTKRKLVNIDRTKIGSVERLYLYYNISTKTLERYLELNVKSDQQTIVINEEEGEKGCPINNWYAEPMCLFPYGDESFLEENTQGAMTIDNVYWLKDKNKIMLECSINKDKVGSGKYKFTGTVYCEEHNSEDQWITEWNSTSLIFEGEKTQNLKNFYKAIRNAFPVEDKKIINFLFYFEI